MIRFVVALDCEAKPLLSHYKLKRDHNSFGFPVYRSEHVALIVSGMGRVAAAAATAYLHAYLTEAIDDISPWLNLGCGGHRELALGELFIGHKILEKTTAQRWYPVPVLDSSYFSQTITTVDKPETDYPEDTIYEMEASGFFATASRFTSGELCQTVKIISDNADTPLAQWSKQAVSDRIAAHLSTFDSITEQLTQLADELNQLKTTPAYYDRLLTQWHFSHNQRIRLRHHIRRYHLLYPEHNDATTEALLLKQNFADAKALLNWLDTQISNAPPRIY